MNRRIKAVIIIEILILLGLLFHVARTPHMWIMLVLAIVFTILANRSRARFFRVISFIFWGISAMILFTAGWFWLAIVFPAIMAIIFWKNNPRNDQQGVHHVFRDVFQGDDEEDELLTKANGNDIIDLDDVHFKVTGNNLSIKKNTGNTKIIVPADVGVSLDMTVGTGIIKIFDEPPKVNAGNIRYFSENIEKVHKRIRITLRVETGNIEIIQG